MDKMQAINPKLSQLSPRSLLETMSKTLDHYLLPEIFLKKLRPNLSVWLQGKATHSKMYIYSYLGLQSFKLKLQHLKKNLRPIPAIPKIQETIQNWRRKNSGGVQRSIEKRGELSDSYPNDSWAVAEPMNNTKWFIPDGSGGYLKWN